MDDQIPYDQYVQKIRSFRRDEILIQSSYRCWEAWDQERSSLNNKNPNFQLIRAYAPRISAISAARGNNFRKRLIENSTVLDLCRWHLRVRDSVSNKRFIAEEREKCELALKETKYLYRFKIDTEAIEKTAPFAFIQRTIRSQWDARSFTLRHIFRSSCIYRKLIAKQPTVEPTIFKILNQDADSAIKAGFGLFTMLNGKRRDHGRALLNIDRSDIEKAVEINLGITLTTLKLIASRLSIDRSELNRWHTKVCEQEDYYKKYYPLPFYGTPLLVANNLDLEADIDESDAAFICPSPEMLLAGCSFFLTRLMIDNSSSMEGNISSSLGIAVEEYVAEMLPTIFPSERIERLSKSGKPTADFLVDLDECYLIIECKRLLTNAEGRMTADPNSQVKIWDRMLEALSQCSSTVRASKTLSESRKPILCLILTDDTLLFEEKMFALIAETSGIFKELGIQFFETIHLEIFERLFAQVEMQTIVDVCMSNWKSFRENPSAVEFNPLSNTDFHKAKEDDMPLIENEFQRLFPNLKWPEV
ncbi:MAG: hypothetical protein K2X47_15540 [Bdellovibrionales bacterium]|nr:hypothetical protein [Bdellovibrionales bacterium]